MEKFEQSARAEAIRTYLEGVGCSISSVQAHEVLARALGHKNKHVLAAKTTDSGKRKAAACVKQSTLGNTPAKLTLGEDVVEVMPLDAKPMSTERMEELDWTFDLVIPVPLSLAGDVDALNEYGSRFITGNDVALEDISYEHVCEVAYGTGFVAYRVSAVVSSPEEHFGVDDGFYKSLGLLSGNLQPGRTVALTREGTTVVCTMNFVDAELLGVFDRYVDTQGENNEEMNSERYKVAVILWPEGQPRTAQVGIYLDALKYANQVSTYEWQLTNGGNVIRLNFAV